MKKLFVSALAALALAGGVIAPSASATLSEPPVAERVQDPALPADSASKGTNRDYREKNKSKVLKSRKATKEDVASGFAATLASTIYICSSAANLENPMTDLLSRSYWVGVAWEESTSSGGRPMARINTGNAIAVHNDSTKMFYFSGSQWDNGYTRYHYGWSRWEYTFTWLNAVAANGGVLTQRVLSDGFIWDDNDRWYNQQSNAAGYRTFVSMGSGSQPQLNISLWGSGSDNDESSTTNVIVDPTNSSPCGDIYSLKY